MYLHIGSNMVVRKKCIIAILDMENTTTSKNGRIFFEKAQKSGIIVSVSEELPKSYIVCEENGEILIYISPISSTTLMKRAGLKDIIDDRKE